MKWLSNTLVFAPIPYTLCRSEKEFRKLLKKLGLRLQDQPEYMPAGAGAVTQYFPEEADSSDVIIVCFDKESEYTTIQRHGILVHEAVHVWQHMREAIGETNPGMEMESYAIQTISQQLMEAYDRE